MKFLYQWDDWGLFHVEEVEVIETNVRDERYPSETFAAVKCGPKSNLVLQKHIFDTYGEAYRFGLENTPKGAF